MQYEAKTPAEYLSQLEADWRKEKLVQVRELLKANGPELEEIIKYKMLGYMAEDVHLFSLNAQRAYVSLYIGDINKVPGGRELLEGYDMGKGCIRLKKSTNLEDGRLGTFIERVMSQWKEGSDVGC